MKYTFGEVEIAAVGGGAPQRARSRKANSVTGVVHQVIVMPNDTGVNYRAALCGFRPRGKRGDAVWVFMPSWPKRDCPTCVSRAS